MGCNLQNTGQEGSWKVTTTQTGPKDSICVVWVLGEQFLFFSFVFFLIITSDVPAQAWPESPGFGLALGGSGLAKSQARPKAKILAWLWLRPGFYNIFNTQVILSLILFQHKLK